MILNAANNLDYIGQTVVFNDSFDDEGETTITVHVYQKDERTGFFADNVLAGKSLKKIGFKKVFTPVQYGDILAYADIVLEYEIGKKPYTITKADVKELGALKAIMDYTNPRIHVCHDLALGLEEVPAREFRQAVVNYLKQHQK